MLLGIDLEPVIALIEAEIWLFQAWVWTLLALFAFTVALRIAEVRHRRSPVDRLLRRRFGGV